MTDQSQADDAEVVTLRIPAQIIRDEGREIKALFPGWKIWHTSCPDTWNAHREGEEPYFGPLGADGRAFMISTYDAATLVALLEDQVRVDIAADFPDWRVKPTKDGWCAVWPERPESTDGTVIHLVYRPTITCLSRALRARCDGQGIGHGA